jgi:hypothetical protein
MKRERDRLLPYEQYHNSSSSMVREVVVVSPVII